MVKLPCALIILAGICGTSRADVANCLRMPAAMQKACMDYTTKADYVVFPAIEPEFARTSLHLKPHKKRIEHEKLDVNK